MFVVDDDAAVRDALLALLGSVAIDAVGFDSGDRFLQAFDPESAGCVLLDVRMPGTGGLAVAGELRARHSLLPIVFISAHADVRLTVEAMRLGAEDVIEKPFRDQDVIDRVQDCLELDRRRRERRRESLNVRRRLDSLSPRERLVLARVMEGQPTKEIAAALSLSARTIETHRAHLMKKMGARSLAALVAMVTRTLESDDRQAPRPIGSRPPGHAGRTDVPSPFPCERA